MIKENMQAWQSYPEKFIRYAGKFENTKDDFERLVGYLLLDVGVESLLKAFVLAETSLKYSERESSVKGIVERNSIPDSKITTVNFEKITFHNLLETVKLAAKSKVTDEELKNVDHYHGIRNIIYHEGRKTIPSEQDFKNYLNLAKTLLQRLLDLNEEIEELESQTDKPWSNDITGDDYLDFIVERGHSQDTFNELRLYIAIAITLFRPKYAIRNFKESLNQLWMEYVDTLSPGSGIPPSVYEYAETELIKEFNDLTGQKIHHTQTILKMCEDVTYLQLAVLLTKLGQDVNNQLNKYVEFRDYVKGINISNHKINKDDIERINDFYTWIKILQEKINSFIDERISYSKSE